MRLVSLRLVTRDLPEGWSPLEDYVPIGREYVVDLDRQALGVFIQPETGAVAQTRCVWAVLPTEGYIPACFLGLSGTVPTPRP